MRKLCRVMFSRYAISAILILAEIALMVFLYYSASTYSFVAFFLAMLTNIFAVIFIINKDDNPESKVAWIITVLIFPFLGLLLYLMFSQRRMTRREVMLLAGSFSQLNLHRKKDESFEKLAEASPLAAGKAKAIMNDDAISEVFCGTTSEFFPTGEEFFEDLIAELSEARDFIFLEYFIIADGVLWNRIHKILKEKASCGLDVRVLYDDIGCMKTLPHYYEYTLRSEGIKAHRFGKVSPKISSVHNNRDHRKICVIDGRVGYTGGVNIADEYINAKKRFGYWKDGGVKISGDAVRGLIKGFLSAWDYTAKSISDYERFIESVKPAENADGGYYIPFCSGPVPVYKRPSGKNAFLNLINQAQNYVYITTPYLVIDYELTEALCNAALRGVDVRIITPGIPDKKKIKIMTKSSYPHLIEAGVKIYEYTPGFIHEKTFVSDDKYAVVGTINLDFRSLVHHFENAIWMFLSPTVNAAHDEFMKTLKDCEKIDRTKSRLSFSEWLVRNAIKFFAPLM